MHKSIVYSARYCSEVIGQLHASSALPAEEQPSRCLQNGLNRCFGTEAELNPILNETLVPRSSSHLPTISRRHKELSDFVYCSAFCWLQETHNTVFLTRGDLRAVRCELLKSDTDILRYMACIADVFFRNLIASHVEAVSTFSPTFQLLSSG
jgi:hypothetical protein